MPKEFIINGEVIIQEDALDNYDEGISLTLNFIPIHQISYKPSNGFGAYVCELADAGDTPPVLNVKGVFIRPLDLGQSYAGTGIINSWRGQKQFKVEDIKKIMPKGQRGIISFLKSLDGMKYQAEIIWDVYKENSLKIIKEHPLDLMGLINGAYPEMLLSWQYQVQNIKDDYDVLNKLMDLGIRSDQGKILYDKYGSLVFNMLKENPYFLSKEVSGYGFKKCDNIARKIGVPINDTNRISEGIMMLLKNNEDEGNVFIEKDILNELAIDILSLKMSIPETKKALSNLKKDGTYDYIYGDKIYNVDGFSMMNAIKAYNQVYSQKQKESCKIVLDKISETDIENAYNFLQLEERIIIENNKVFRKEMYLKESSIAFFIKEIVAYSKPINIDMEKLLENYCNKNKISLEEKQRESVLNSASDFGNISIINGAAGCGKTFCIKVILNLLEDIYINKQNYFSKIIIAPTGKASRVAAKATGIESSTIHKVLKCLPGGGFFYNVNNKLPYDCIIIDESSMIDCNLAYHLFAAISPRTKVIMMGDTNQLASIGPGNVLRDLINSGCIKITTLNVVKRQGLDSGIVNNSHKIIRGEMIASNKETKDFLIYKGDSTIDYIEKVLKQCDKLVSKYGIENMQILASQRTGPLGTNYLNFIMQERFNLVKSDEKILKQRFEINIDGLLQEYELYLKKGDKVINTRNNYNMPVYQLDGNQLILDSEKLGITNGETGTIVDIIQRTNEYNEWDNLIVVKFEDKYIVYKNDFDDLELCYAMTIHKSQGSEWPAVLLVAHPSHKYMLDKNILYTGITRAKEINIIISDAKTLKDAINTNKVIKRNTNLIEKIRKSFDYN